MAALYFQRKNRSQHETLKTHEKMDHINPELLTEINLSSLTFSNDYN